MSSKNKTNDKSSMEQSVHITSIDSNNDLIDSTESYDEDLKIVFIPKSQHEHFECVVGKHVFVDNPWTNIPHKKIIDHIQSQNEKSCFWPFRKLLGGIKTESVLVGYKPYSDTNEEFLLCSTDKAKQFIQETQTQMEREFKQKVERSMFRVPGPWESKSSDKDVEEIKPVQTREKITYKWKLPAGRLLAKAKFEDSNSKSMKNEYVKLEPRSKEIFESSNIFTRDSSAQAVKKMVTREMQTIPRIKDNKCIQSVAIEEEMFQPQLSTKPDKALDEFLNNHVPNLVKQLRYNELYDLYRDDYKMLKNEYEKPTEQTTKSIKLLLGYQNDQKKYVSSFTWHPTIPGIFAVSFMTNSKALYKSVSLKNSSKEVIESTIGDKNYDNLYSDNRNDQESLNDQLGTKLIDENYKEKIIELLNKEFVQRMRIIQVTEDEKANQEIIKELRNSLIYVSHEQPSIHKDLAPVNLNSQLNLKPTAPNQQTRSRETIETDIFSKEFDYDTIADENLILNETESEVASAITQKNIEQCSESNLNDEYSIEEDKYYKQNEKVEDSTIEKIINVDGDDYYDSDAESFYNIWGDDEEWLYGDELRNTVRSIHRQFNKKYDRKAREEKLFRLLKSESKYTDKKNKIADMDKERMKLTKDLFEAGDVYQRLKMHQELKSKKITKSLKKQDKKYEMLYLHNDENVLIRQKDHPIYDQQNNAVLIWSTSDHIFPKLRLGSPEEVCCIEFNPRNGNTIVGGLINGQICIWDLEGKLETTNSHDSNKSEKEKLHHEHLWMYMKWSLNVNFKTRVRPAALSAILHSHESTVTAIQWIHPMTEITPLGKLVTVSEERFSDQFFSASMDGTIKLWDLHSTPLPKSKQQERKNTKDTRFGCPENLNKYKSPLSVYNNRLKPSYTIAISEPGNKLYSPITALSFEIPLMQYKYTSNQPLEIGKRLFEYLPTTPDDLNRIIVVGNIMGQIGVVTWNGYEKHQENQNKEDCQHIWWGHMHDGPINCIQRNCFFPDIYLVCGGRIVSIWSLNYNGGPIWWKRFPDFITSVSWSSVYPAEYRISFDKGNVLQFWNLMKHTHRPYFTSEHLSDGVILTLSTPHPPMHYVGIERFGFAEGINGVMDCGRNELIGFSDSVGTVRMVTVNATVPGPGEVERVGHMFQKEVDRRRELDAWNDKYKTEFGSKSENDVDADNYAVMQSPIRSSVDVVRPTSMTPDQVKRKIGDETYKWYLNRRGPQTRLNKMKEKYMEREKQHMVEAMMKKKNVNKKQLDEYFKEVKMKTHDEKDIRKMRLEADETYRDIVNKLLIDNQAEKSALDNSKNTVKSDGIKKHLEKIHQLLVTDIEDEREKFRKYIKNNPFKVEQEDWDHIIEFSETEVRDRLNDRTLLKNPALRMMRRQLTKKYIDEGYKIKEWKSRKESHANDKYKIREDNINKLRAMYGKHYDPFWDKGLGQQKMKDAVRMRVIQRDDEDFEQSYTGNFEEGGEGDSCYNDYLSLMEPSSISNYQDQTGIEMLTGHNNDKDEALTTKPYNDNDKNQWDNKLFKYEQTRNQNLYENGQIYDENDEYQEELIDEQNQENKFKANDN